LKLPEKRHRRREIDSRSPDPKIFPYLSKGKPINLIRFSFGAHPENCRYYMGL
jgi:hypothetical protein